MGRFFAIGTPEFATRERAHYEGNVPFRPGKNEAVSGPKRPARQGCLRPARLPPCPERLTVVARCHDLEENGAARGQRTVMTRLFTLCHLLSDAALALIVLVSFEIIPYH